MSNEWFLYQDNEQKGPFTDSDFKKMAANQGIKPDNLVWTEGMTEWSPAEAMEGLLPKGSTTPPPLPEILISNQPPPIPSIPPAPTAGAKDNKQAQPVGPDADEILTPLTTAEAPTAKAGQKKKQRLMKIAIIILVVLTLFATGAIAASVYLEKERTIAWAEGTYTGQVSLNMPQGVGTWEHPDGENGLYSGQGTLSWQSGASYAGDFKEGLFSGQGTYTWPDGDKYSGQFENNTANGLGVYYFADGRTYEGEFIDDDFYGEGLLNRLDGSQLMVTFLENYFIQLDYPEEGIRYVGEHINLIPNGSGNAVFSNGDEYLGEFLEGRFHGRGAFIYADGEMYDGEFALGRRNGVGTYTYNDGAKYIGDFKNDLFHGEGTYIWPDGKRTTGRWENDEYVGR